MNLTCMEVEHSSANNMSEGRKCVSFATLSHLALNPELTDKYLMGFLGSSADKESACNAGDPGSIPGLAKIPWRRDRLPTPVFLGFSGASDSKESTCNAGDPCSITGLGRFPWRRERLPTPVVWPGEFQGPYSSWGCKESDVTERLSLSLSFFPQPQTEPLFGNEVFANVTKLR